MHTKRYLSFVFGFLLVVAGSAAAFRLCPVRHLRIGSPDAGSFDFSGTEYAGVAANCQGTNPPATFFVLTTPPRSWKFGDWGKVPCYELFQNAALDMNLPGYTDAEWVLVNADIGLYGWPGISGPETIAAESSFVDSAKENTPQHRSFYAVAAVVACNPVDLGNVTNGLGPSGNIVPLKEVPVPTVLGYQYGPDAILINVRVQDPSSYTDGQADPVAGQLLLYVYAPSGEPRRSDPAFYDQVLNPTDVTKVYGLIPKGTTDVTVAVPYPGGSTGGIYLVSQIAYFYNDIDHNILSAGTSGNSAPVPPGWPVLPPSLNLAKSFDPDNPAAGQTVHCTILLENEADVSALNVSVRDNLDLGPGCLDLSSVRNLSCPRCTTLNYNSATGDLLGTKDELPGTNDPGNNFLLLDFDATAVSGLLFCTNTAYAEASGRPAVAADAVLRPFISPALNLIKIVDPTRPKQGDYVRYRIILENDGNAEARDVVITDNLDLDPMCLDPDSVTNLSCPRCDTISYDPVTGGLRATVTALPDKSVPGANVVTITFDVKVLSDTADCENRSRATASNHPEVQATAAFGPSLPGSLRRFALTSTTGNDLSWVFPPAPYLTPAPALPWIDKAGVLSDTSHPLIFYQDDDLKNIYLLADKSANTIRVCSSGTCP